MRDRLRKDLAEAIKARDSIAVTALRTTLAAIENAEAVPQQASGLRAASSAHFAGASAGIGSSDVPRRALGETEVVRIVQAQVEERREAATAYDTAGRGDRADALRREAAILNAYLRTSAPEARQ